MASFSLNWTPPGGLSSIAQQVQYKVASASSWVVAATLGATDDSYEVVGLLDNVIYDFRIVNMCSSGGNVPGSSIRGIVFACPLVNVTPASDTVGFNFVHLGGSLTSYDVDLMDSSGATTLDSKAITSPGSVVADSFTGLDPTTQYRVVLTMHAGVYSNVCPYVSVTTTVVPTCGIPSSLVVSIG